MMNSMTSDCASDPAGTVPKKCSRAFPKSSRSVAGGRGAHHLRRRVRRHLPPGEAAAGGEGDGDGGVEVRAGDVAHRVHHHHHGEAPHDADARERHRAARAQVHRHRRAPDEDQEEGPEDLGEDLLHERDGEHGAADGSILLRALTVCFISSSAFLHTHGALVQAVCKLCSCHLCLQQQQQQRASPRCKEEEEEDEKQQLGLSTIYGVQFQPSRLDGELHVS